ncbi:MAG: phosphoribosylaminoimidazolesuccinocarboxamide synthase [Acidobacteriaceae bacterium]
MNALLQSDIPELKLISRGKVRDIYELDGDLLMIASDRISAFDHILGSGIPGKGKVLTQISKFWFDKFADVVPNHLITADVNDLPSLLDRHKPMLEGRFMRVKRAKMFPVECVVRGYISGSGWKDYQSTGEIGCIRLPQGLRDSDRLPEPIFTPATKAEFGEHDENISFAKMADIIGQQDASKLRDLSIELYQRAARHAESCGILIADTKFEFGVTGEGILLGDEALTPDSSRFWPRDQYEPGRQQASFDKQYVRNYLEEIHWNKQAPAPSLPPEVVTGTQERYLEAYRLLTGHTLQL